MKKKLFALSALIIFLTSCEVEVVDGRRYYHHRGWEREHYPNHQEVYDHGYHHDRRGNEIIEHRR